MILVQVRDLAAKSCGEPHVAPSWEIAQASLGSMLAKTPEIAERAHSIVLEWLSEWDPEVGCLFCYDHNAERYDYIEVTGDVCLAEFLAACRKEEDLRQAEADDPRQAFSEEACKRQNEEDVKNVVRFREGLKQSEVSVDG